MKYFKTRFNESINTNHATENIRLANQWKIQLRTISNLVLRTLRSHITLASFKSFMPYKISFAFLDRVTGVVKYDGLILLRMMIEISKPDTVIDLCEIELELDTITLHPSCGNNVNKCISNMLLKFQEILARTGEASYIDNCFITNHFHAFLTCPVEKFETFADQLKKRWIMDELTDPYEICKNIEKMAKNMNANKEFKSDTTKNQKIVALTSKVNNMFKRVQSAERARDGGNGYCRGGDRRNGGGTGKTLFKIKVSGSVACDL